jgi:Domain of unknown function (DUF4149)
MTTIVTTAGLFATALLLGSMAFFSTVIAPLIFLKLDGAVAGRFIRQVFPWYYLVVIILSALAALCVTASRMSDAVALAAIAIAGLVARQILMPKINRARDAVLAGDRSSQTSFSRLHRLSVYINAAQMIVAGVVLARFI